MCARIAIAQIHDKKVFSNVYARTHTHTNIQAGADEYLVGSDEDRERGERGHERTTMKRLEFHDATLDATFLHYRVPLLAVLPRMKRVRPIKNITQIIFWIGQGVLYCNASCNVICDAERDY